MEDILGKAGITASMPLENEPRLPALEKVTNEDGNQRCTFQMFYVWLRTLYGEYWPDQPPTIQAIIRSLSARLAKLKKQHSLLKKMQ